MKNSLFLVLAMLLILGTSCQKKEEHSLEVEKQEVVYTYQAVPDENRVVSAASAPLSTSCNCSLNVRANMNNTNDVTNFPNNDWAVEVGVKTSPTSWSSITSLGFGSITSYDSWDWDSSNPEALGPWESYPFTVEKGASLRLIAIIPFDNDFYADKTIVATVSCIKANQNPISKYQTGPGYGNVPYVYGSVTNDCSAIAAF